MVLHEDDVRPTVAAWEHALRTGETYQIEHRVQRADGSYHWYLSRGMPVRDGAGRIVKWFGTATDIDKIKQAEEALRELTATLDARVAQRTAELKHRARQLQQLTLEMSEAEERERKRLAEILHDDLQQQLAAAKFHLGLLSVRLRGDAPLQEAAAEVTGMLKDAIEKTRSLSHELSPALLYQGDFGEALEWLANQMQAKHGLVVHVQTRGPAEIASDPVRAFLFRTAREILFNTVKHARVAEATVRLQRRRGCLWLTISDKGRGFDPRALGQTAGFGLLSTRERVELLGGRMKIRSAPGRGSTFLIAVPDGEVLPQMGAAGADAATPHKARERLRVLLADDHEVVREGLALLLNEQEDIEVVGQAANGVEALDLAHRLQPDVVVMDVAMPLMEGDEAARQIKRDMPRTRIVGLSMFEEPEAVEKMHQAGVERYMLKTAPAEELLAAIREK
jgi:signal transduction histidine kinase/CheY-like chemotaxis protein